MALHKKGQNINKELYAEGQKVNVRDVEKVKKTRAGNTPLRERLIEDLHHHFSDGTVAYLNIAFAALLAFSGGWRTMICAVISIICRTTAVIRVQSWVTRADFFMATVVRCRCVCSQRTSYQWFCHMMSPGVVRLPTCAIVPVDADSCGLRIAAVKLEVTDIDAKQGCFISVRAANHAMPLPGRALQLHREMEDPSSFPVAFQVRSACPPLRHA
jgi:hypothetical protein